jgi:PilZ domain
MMVMFRNSAVECVGEIRDVGLGGLRVRVPKRQFQEGERVVVGPPDEDPLEYEVCWLVSAGAGFEMGLRYPHSMASFWNSWAADMLAGTRWSIGEVVERRRQVRLGCTLKGQLQAEGEPYEAVVLDLGGGGALVETSESLPEGVSVRLTVENPVRVGDLPCEVVRAWPGTPARYGLAFVGLRERHRLALVRLLDLLLRQGT